MLYCCIRSLPHYKNIDTTLYRRSRYISNDEESSKINVDSFIINKISNLFIPRIKELKLKFLIQVILGDLTATGTGSSKKQERYLNKLKYLQYLEYEIC